MNPLALAATLAASSFAATAAPTPLRTILDRAVANSERVHARLDATRASEASARVARTAYLPNVAAEAIYSSGFPGSSGLLGVSGVMGSPFRHGLAFGLTARQTLFDAQVYRDVARARAEIAAERAAVDVDRWAVTQDAIQMYYACAHAATATELWSQVAVASREVETEVARFVKTGQRTPVDGLLAEAQAEEARRFETSFKEQLAVLQRRLAVLTGLDANDLGCPTLAPEAPANAVGPAASALPSVFVRRAESRAAVADAEVAKARAGYLPKLSLVGSVGDLDQVRLVEKKDYAIGVGLTMPLFDGLRTPREVERAHALRTQAETETRAARQYAEDLNLKFDQAINADRGSIAHLLVEVDHGRRAFELARKRYVAFSGQLVDVRESIRNFSRLRAELAAVQAEYFAATALKAAFNGEEP